MPWYAAAPNLTAITEDETGSKRIMQNEWEALMVIEASAKPVEVMVVAVVVMLELVGGSTQVEVLCL
jgi:hypothetical protein